MNLDRNPYQVAAEELLADVDVRTLDRAARYLSAKDGESLGAWTRADYVTRWRAVESVTWILTGQRGQLPSFTSHVAVVKAAMDYEAAGGA